MESLSAHDLLLNCIFYRMCFGASMVQTHTKHSHLIVYTQITLGCLVITCGIPQKYWLKHWEHGQWARLKDSECKPCEKSPKLSHIIRIKSFPRWPGLYHFKNGAFSISFSDGSTFEDLSLVFFGTPLHIM